MAGRVRVTDKGAAKLLRMVRRANAKPAVRVGVFGDNAAQAHGDSGATVGDIANAHEFGAGNVPQRSWLRGTIDTNRGVIDRNIRRAAEEVFRGRMKEFQALELLGFSVQGMIQQRIAAGISPALTARYLARKLRIYPGASTPLIASGQFRGSVSFALEGDAAKAKSVAVAKASRAQKSANRERRRAERKARRRERQVQRVRKAIKQGLRKGIKLARKNAAKSLKLTRKGVKLTKKNLQKGARVSKRALRKSVQASFRAAKKGRRILKRGAKVRKRRNK